MRMSVRYSGRQNNRPKQLSVPGFFEENGSLRSDCGEQLRSSGATSEQ
jgi:hypothetical protein